ncbi:hypothetical protein A2160_05200 [Candidatus Beckwithbacteria bacterium RBG_13_42_9]|uniref:Uncharacterized protein n=1 Tax=Candidatus Beckwithbacteria bacterium RBG_13_42_9 TaxID=1797457 RepID=A0A1F5E6X0_9BACT|nr:MAG: hypothetical protein A2160_05200 [Candidatus Beckwithbacteria bacterium RBG_13_42_9]
MFWVKAEITQGPQGLTVCQVEMADGNLNLRPEAGSRVYMDPNSGNKMALGFVGDSMTRLRVVPLPLAESPVLELRETFQGQSVILRVSAAKPWGEDAPSVFCGFHPTEIPTLLSPNLLSCSTI